MSKPCATLQPPDLLEIHREVAALLSKHPAIQLVGIGRDDPDLPQYITINIRYKTPDFPRNDPLSRLR